MSTSLNVMNSVVFVQTLIKNQRLNINGQEPALTMANIVLQKILGPPFIWRQNRGSFTINISAGLGTDYAIALSTLGRIETQWLVDATNTITELTGAVAIAKVGSSRRPTKVAAVYDDNAGNVTFRFNSIPDKNYTAFFDYQKKAQLITSWANPWGVIPDELSYIYNLGFLSLAALVTSDARFQIWNRQFVGSLLAAQDGLDEQARALFLQSWLTDARSIQRSAGEVQSGVAGRGV